MAPTLRAAIALLSFLLTALTSAQDVPIPLICHDDGVQVIAAVGAGIVNGSQSYGLTYSFILDTMIAIPNSSNFSLNYNRSNINLTAPIFIAEVQEGGVGLYNAIYNYTTACPNTPVVLHGYSEGSVVVMNLICGASSGSFPVTQPLDASYASHIIAIIVYGDESRTANQSYNYGDCTASGPRLARRTPQGCDAFASSIQSYCFANDVDCCATANASAPYPWGINPHFLYPAAYDTSAVSFVVDQHAKYLNGTLNQSSTTSTSSTAPTSTSSSSDSSSSSFISTSTSDSSISTPTPTPSPSSSLTSSDSSTITSSDSSTLTSSDSSTLTSSDSSTLTSSDTSTLSSSPTTPSSTTSVSSTLTSTSFSTTTNTRGLRYQSSCTFDRCLSSFVYHPTTASRYCGYLTSIGAGGASATPTTSPFPTVCAGNYTSRVSSVCSCLIFPSSSGSFSTVTNTSTIG